MKPLRGFVVLPIVLAAAFFLTPASGAAPPTNDNFANATVITSTPFGDTVDIIAATLEPGEPWSIPPTLCDLRASLFLLVYQADGGGLAGLTRFDQASSYTLHVQGGRTYYIQ